MCTIASKALSDMNVCTLHWSGHCCHHNFLHLLVSHNHPGLGKHLVNSTSILDNTQRVCFALPGNPYTNAQTSIQSLIPPLKDVSFFNSARYTSTDSPYYRCCLMSCLYTINTSAAKAVTKAVFIWSMSDFALSSSCW